MLTLSKSDFKIARSCPTKLHYKKLRYPTSNEGNEYLEYLAEGGYMIGKMATLFYPEGIRINNLDGIERAIEQTERELEKDQVTLFEAAILVDGKLAVVDILKKQGDRFVLIEVKSKSFNSDEDPARQLGKSGWKEHLEDVSFQKEVLQERFPGSVIDCYLFLPDKAKRTAIDHLNAQFTIEMIGDSTGFSHYDVRFAGDPEEIRKDALMTLVPVNEQVEIRSQEIRAAMSLFLESIRAGERMHKELDIDCFKCEYNVGDEKNGFRECWKDMPEPEHHIRDLYHLGTLKEDGELVGNILIREKRLSLTDLPEKAFKDYRGLRREIQVKNALKDREWKHPLLKYEIGTWPYPLHFIDFETCITALPFHRGMRPYEMSPFQWSCHTIESPGADPVHSEWLNIEPEFPGFKFARSLMEHIGYEGTFLMWAPHENTTLRKVLDQMDTLGYEDPELKTWLQKVVKYDKHDEGAFIDMNAMALDYYFHPIMKGRTSIKVTLPAVLAANGSPRTEKWLREFSTGIDLLRKDDNGQILNPYEFLPPVELMESAEKVKEGTAAMRAYEDMLFGLAKDDPAKKEAYQRALLNYCKLDTLAMVIIWEHWRNQK